jgi:hypothetical protein
MAARPSLSRRGFLAGVAGAGLLAACGGGDSRTTSASGTLTPVDADTRVLIAGFQFDGGYLVSGVEQRMTFQVAAADGVPTTEVPDALSFRVTRDGQQVGEPQVVDAHRDGIPLPYFPLLATFDAPGTYQAECELDGVTQTQAFMVSDAAEVALVQVGEPLRPVDTPTPTDEQGVVPYCTREPACTLHEPTLRNALQRGAPVALLIGTPAFCRTGLCGPVLDLLLEQVPTHPGVQFLHAEVWADAVAVGDLAQAALAPVIDTYAMTFEPSLLVAGPDGVVVARLDNVYDRVELLGALAKVA